MWKIVRLNFLLLMLFAVINVQAQPLPNPSQNEGSGAENNPYVPFFSAQKKYTITFQPMQMFNNGVRFDFEMRLKDGPAWLQFGPTIYQINFYDDLDHPRYYYYHDKSEFQYYMLKWDDVNLREPHSKMIGGGLDVNYKRFFDIESMFYAAVGLSYSHFNVKYIERVWNTFIEDGLQFKKEALDFRNQSINRFGINCFFGFQPQFPLPFVVDIFGGFTWRLSFSDSDKPSFDKYRISYGHTGSVILMGIRFGFGI